MIDAPWFRKIAAEFAQEAQVKSTLHVLKGRFGSVSEDIGAGLAQVKTEDAQLRLALHAATCQNPEAFKERLSEELPPPPPASTRGRKRKPT
ncbi:MAG: hypothetical protein ACRC33_01660 [Gemmataceae bacterium]